MEDKIQEIQKQLKEINEKIDKLTKQEKLHYENNKSFESKMTQWLGFYIASLVADETLGR